jgi:putative transposase
MIFPHAYKQAFKPDSLTFELAKESGLIYTKALKLNKKEHKNIKQITKEMEIFCQENCKYLQSQSAQAAYQDFILNLKDYFKSLKIYKKDPSKFSGKPKPPHKEKFMYKVTFKKSAIRYQKGFLLLSVKRPYEPIKVKWAKNLPIPIWVIISYNRYEGWSISFVMNQEVKQLALDKTKAMTIDLGAKRTATTFDGKETITYSGKTLMSLNRLRNKVDGKVKSRVSTLKKKSRKYKNVMRSKRAIIKRIKNKENDILHKYSRHIVNNAINKNISRIVIGDNASTHNKTNLGKQNQKVQQNPERKLAKFVQYKFEGVSGETDSKPEKYTSRTCPACGNVKNSSPKGRTYSCTCKKRKCKFTFDRDGVGAINQYKEHVFNVFNSNVSFRRVQQKNREKEWLDVVGGLTPPIGVKYSPRLSLALRKKGRIIDSEVNKESVRPLSSCVS